jgi:DNA polymerase-3 subunit delta'
LKPVRAARRVFVIREADRMSLDAANCFLKTLEEPPGNCLFILIASSLRLIPETIVSRCRIVRFVNLSPQRLQSRLEAEGMEARDAHWLARRAWGSPGLAERFQQMGLHDFNRQLVEKLGQLSAADSLAFSDWLNDAARAAHSGAETRIRLQELLECAALYYRDLALAATAGGSECELCNQAAKDAMKEQAAATSPEAFLDKADLVLETIERIGANAHSRLALDRLFTRLPRPARAPT